jgi:hypothetical protein
MPVPDSSSYSRRYGRDSESYSSYTRSTSTSGLGRSSYLSSYGSKSSSSLPPRPPAYDIRKYTDTSSSGLTGSRFLSSGSRASVSRDYGSTSGSSYRSSVSPVRGSASSIRRQLEASAPSIAERIKAIETSENDEPTTTSSTTGISRTSRFSTLRSQRESPSYESTTRNKYATYSSGYTRDRSGSREYGSSPLSITGSSYLSRLSENNKSSSENNGRQRNSSGGGSRASPPSGPLSRSGSGTNNSSSIGGGSGLRNGTSSSLNNAGASEVNSSSSPDSAPVISASDSSVLAATTTYNTTNKALDKASPATSVLVTTTPKNDVIDVDRKTGGSSSLISSNGGISHNVTTKSVDLNSYDDVGGVRSRVRSKDIENNSSTSGYSSVRSSSSINKSANVGVVANNKSSVAVSSSTPYMNGNATPEERDAAGDNNTATSNKWTSSRSSITKDKSTSKDVSMAATATNESASKLSSSSRMTPMVTATEQDSNGNPILSITVEDHAIKKDHVHNNVTTTVESNNKSGLVTSSKGLSRFRKYESDSNANNILVSSDSSTTPMTNGDISATATKEKSPVEAVVNLKSRSSNATSLISGKQSSAATSISPSGSRTKMGTTRESSPTTTAKPKVLYHTIKVEEPFASREATASPEPVYTITARPSLDGTGPKIELKSGPSLSSSSTTTTTGASASTASMSNTSTAPAKEKDDKDDGDVSADFKFVLPKLKLSTNSSSQESVHNNKSGASSSEDDSDQVNKSMAAVLSSEKTTTITTTPPTTTNDFSSEESSMSRRARRESSPTIRKISLTTSIKKEDTPPPANSKREQKSLSREATPTRTSFITSSRKSPSPGVGSKISANNSRASPETNNINASSDMGIHQTKNAYGSALLQNSSSSPTNRNERIRNAHLASDSSDNVSE